jgi:hypothetical protein
MPITSRLSQRLLQIQKKTANPVHEIAIERCYPGFQDLLWARERNILCRNRRNRPTPSAIGSRLLVAYSILGDSAESVAPGFFNRRVWILCGDDLKRQSSQLSPIEGVKVSSIAPDKKSEMAWAPHSREAA